MLSSFNNHQLLVKQLIEKIITSLLATTYAREVNLNKTKEIVLGPLSKTSHLPLLQLSAGHIERVNSVKLLGVNLNADFSWKSHVEAITSKATQRLYFSNNSGVRVFPQPSCCISILL